MLKIFIGIVLIFFKIDLSFFDISWIYYATNILGYSTMLWGIKELSSINKNLLKVQPYIIIMIVQSIIFFILNGTNHSPLTLALSNTIAKVIAFTGTLFIIAGMFLIFVIITKLLDELADEETKQILYKLVNIMMILFILAGICAFLNFIPLLTSSLMGALLLMQILFLINYYQSFLKKNQKYI